MKPLKFFALLTLLTGMLILTGQLSAKIVRVEVKVNPASYKGKCPKIFTFTGLITSDRAGLVKYRWLRSDNAVTPEQTIRFTSPGTQTVTTSWTLGGPGKNYKDWQALRVLSPNLLTSKRAVFTLTCMSPKTMQLMKPVKPVLSTRPQVFQLAHRFEIQGIKRILTTPEKVTFQVQYYISPNYPKPCFISAYVPNKINQSSKFAYSPAGRFPNGVPKGQKHFTDNVNFTVHFNGPGEYTSNTIEVVIYDADKNLKTTIINWGQKWFKPFQMADLKVNSVTVSKYDPSRKTTFSFYIKNIGGVSSGPTPIYVWFYKLNSNGSLPATPNEFWNGSLNTIAPGGTAVWTHDRYNFLVEGNFRLKIKVNPHNNITESNYANNTLEYDFTIPN
jgi:hypothetical protein